MITSGEREKLERENQAVLQDKLDSLKLEIEQEKAELKARIPHYVTSTIMYSVTR